MNFARIFYVFFLLLLCTSKAQADASETTVTLGPDADHVKVAQPLLYFPVPTDTRIDEIAANPQAFKPHAPNLGYQDGAAWIKVPVAATGGSGTWWVEVGEPRLKQLDLYQRTEDGTWQRLRTGLSVPAADQPIRERRNIFPLELTDGEHTELYIRVVSLTALDLPVTFWRPDAYARNESDAMLFLGVLIGLAGGASLYYLIVFFIMRDRAAGWFAFSMFGLALYLASYEGLLQSNLAAWLGGASLELLALGVAFLLIGLTEYTRHYLELWQSSPRLNLFTWVAQGFNGLLVLLALWGPYQITGPLITQGAIVTAIFMLICGVLLWRKRYFAARLFLFTVGFLWVAAILSLLEITAVIPTVFGIAGRIGLFLLVIPMLAATLAYRQRLFKLQRDEAEERALAAERELVQNLEALVAKRTRQARDAQHRAEEANQAKSDFLSTVTHELRTPLTTVLGAADLLEETPLDGRQQQLVSAQRHASGHLLSLIDDILDLARLEHGVIDLLETTFSPDQLLTDVESIMAPLASQKGLTFHVESYGLPERIYGDDGRVRQILTNLCANAVKYTEEGGVSVRVTGIEKDEAGVLLSIEVEDTGPGIAGDHLEVLFDPFFTGQPGTQQSTGLGLAITARLVERLDGAIDVRSEPGRGSCFEVILPFKMPKDDEQRDPEQTKVLPQRILLVEDQAENRMIITDLLQSDGHRVTAVADGESAIQAAIGQPFDYVLMDRRLPDGDGLVLGVKIQALGRQQNPNAAVLLLTANATTETLTQCRKQGLDGLMTKPVRRNQMRKALAGRYRWPTMANSTAPADALPPHKRREMSRLYQQTVNLLWPELKNALEDGDTDAVAKTAHQLAGGAALLGREELASLARQVELDAEAGELASAKELLDQLGSA